ncbi:MAG: recombination protein RecR [Chloroflexi bacterium AL-W]|nr:recombination protein RecR [Chloroflexi bacterium AL-N1]NOK70919.1 recombination protein RecR [Chloroflexi bacterium AL-N10]NOK78588.1 recombination protein RecR [Chloroflexi bacterium AL-N5]NOK85820.1 recombination protein RecR [Chloroflexi bacterium AL-W]NOK92736.1 recombination protein RecR [Chloroflexi bacterium AL-N15]
MQQGFDSQQLAEPVAHLIEEFGRLPGIGPKTAARLTFFLLRNNDDQAQRLSQALLGLKDNIRFCARCYNITTEDVCVYCKNSNRDPRVICVVEEPLDLIALERTGKYHGLYHVLHGRIAPLEGMNREDIYFDALIDRVRVEGTEEVIIATNPNLEGDATAYHLQRALVPLGVRVSQLGRGLPTGGDLEWADPSTLGLAIDGRREL